MKKYIVLILIILPLSLYSQVREHLLPDNSVLGAINVFSIFEDSQDRIWAADGAGQLHIKDIDGWHKNVHDSLKPLMIDCNGEKWDKIRQIFEDNHKNIICYSGGAMAIFNNKDWQLLSGKENLSVNRLNDILVTDDKLYYQFADYKIHYLEYDSSNNKYTHNYEHKISYPDSIWSSSYYVKKNDELIGYNGLFLKRYNLKTNSWSANNNIFSSARPKRLAFEGNEYELFSILKNKNNVITSIAIVNKDTLEIQVIKDDESYSTYRCPYAGIGTQNYFCDPLFIDKEENTILIYWRTMLLTFNEKEGFKSITKPKDASQKLKFWDILSMCLVKEDELWVGTLTDGIFVFDFKALLADSKDLQYTSSVEINPYLPMMDIYSIYPQPNANFVNFEYYLQSGLFSDLKASLFDSFGKRIENISYDNTNKESVISTIKLNTTSLSAGVYILQIDNGGNKATAKFIVEK